MYPVAPRRTSSPHPARSAFALVLGVALLWTLPASAAPRVSGSSYKAADDGESYVASNAFDGLITTAWAEDAPGTGRGEWLLFDFGTYTDVNTVTVWGGNFSDPERSVNYNRVAKLELEIKSKSGTVTKTLELPNRFDRADLEIETKAVRSIKFIIKDTHGGRVYDDTYIAEIAFDFTRPPQKVIDKVQAWTSSSDYEKQKTVFDSALTTAFIDIKSEDREKYTKAYAFLLDAASEGPEFVKKKMPYLASYGYRKSFNQSYTMARSFLVEVDDGRGLDALKIAKAGARKRSTIDDIERDISTLAALIELSRDGASRVDNWGGKGLSKGALNGRGVPLDIDIDADGNIYIADTGNNRVQMFNNSGRVEKVWGGERGLSPSWFGDDTERYAAGSMPGEKPGEFWHPMAISVGQWSDFAVIDARNRVQIFDATGAPMASFVIPTAVKPTPNAGMQTPIISWWADDFYFFLDDEWWVYNHKGELQRNGRFPKGSIRAAVCINRRMVVHHDGYQLDEYTLDGLPEGSFLKTNVPDDGSEGWDFYTDEKDNLYILTDAGRVHIYNKKGKFTETVDAFEFPRPLMRFAYFDNVFYVTVDNKIDKVDRRTQPLD